MCFKLLDMDRICPSQRLTYLVLMSRLSVFPRRLEPNCIQIVNVVYSNKLCRSTIKTAGFRNFSAMKATLKIKDTGYHGSDGTNSGQKVNS